MRSPVWIVILAGLMFAVGWTANDINSKLDVETDDKAGSSKSESSAHSPTARSRRNSPVFPELDLMDELSLTDEQRTEIDALVAEVQGKLHDDELLKREYIDSMRVRMDSILTDAQRTDMENLVTQRFNRYASSRVDASVAWLRERQPEISESVMTQFQAVLSNSFDRQLEKMRERREDVSGDRRRDFETMLDERNRDLKALLGDDLADDFVRNEFKRRRGGGRSGGSRGGAHGENGSPLSEGRRKEKDSPRD